MSYKPVDFRAVPPPLYVQKSALDAGREALADESLRSQFAKEGSIGHAYLSPASFSPRYGVGSFTIEVPSWDRRSDGAIYYEFLIKCGRMHWYVHYRYSHLREVLVPLNKDTLVATIFPPKTWFRPADPAALNARKTAIAEFLNSTLRSQPHIVNDESFRRFAGFKDFTAVMDAASK